MASQALTKEIDALRDNGLGPLATNVEALDLILTTVRALALSHWPSVTSGSQEQADVVLRLLPMVLQQAPEEDPEAPGYGGSDPGEPPER